MITKNRGYMYKIGEFAKIANVTRKTLRHYDKIDLLKPYILDEKNKYRMYSVAQLEQMHTIQLLKKSGYSLLEIREFFESNSSKEMLLLLEDSILNIQEEINNLKSIESNLKRKTELLRFALEESDSTSVKIKELPERYIYCESIDNQALDEEIPLVLFNILSKHPRTDYSMSEVGLIISKSEYIKNDTPNFDKFFVFAEEQGSETETLRAGKYASLKHMGTYKNLVVTLERLLCFVDENGYEIDGPILDFGIVDNLITKDESQFITEIQIPIKI